MAFAHSVRTKTEMRFMPELTPDVLYEYLRSFHFVGVDPSCLDLVSGMKKEWEKAGRPSTHYYQGFREIRWESVKKSLTHAKEMLYDESTGSRRETKDKTSLLLIKEMIESLVMRDGFKIGGEASYVIENWENCRHAQEELVEEGRRLSDSMEPRDKDRLTDLSKTCSDDWILDKHYSPDRAEKFRSSAREKMYSMQGVK
jgi:hypothetical protein